MKHSWKITLVLLGMFIVAQLIGLYIIHVDPLTLEANVNGTIQSVPNPQLSFIQPPEGASPLSLFFNILLAFVIAIGLMFILMRYKVKFFLRLWFFLVVVFALWIVFYTIEIIVPFVINPLPAVIIPLIFAVPLAYIKIYRKNMIVHNLTELLVYPGIAVIFVSLLTQWSPIKNLILIIFLLILISIYDMWAVWHSGIMQKMAKYQIDTLEIFSGFFIPHLSKKQKAQIKNLKSKYTKAQLKKKNIKIKVNLAILGGGDVIFPIITSGIVLKAFGWWPALLVSLGATLGLAYLLLRSEKKKFYPAMPFITAGIFAAMLLAWVLRFFF